MNKNINLINKAVFVIVLIGLGFTFEYLVYRNSDQNVRSLKDGSGKRILMVGGSILKKLPGAVETVAKNSANKNLEFFSIIHPSLSAKAAKAVIEKSIGTIKPDVVFLLVGFHEAENVTHEFPLLDPDVRMKFSELGERKDPEFNHYLIKVLKDLLRTPGSLSKLRNLKSQIKVQHFQVLDRQFLSGELKKIVGNEINSWPSDPLRVMSLLHLSEMLLHNRKTPMLTFHNDLARFVIQGGEIVRTRGCSAIDPEEFPEFIPTDFQWLCYVSGLDEDKDLPGFLSKFPGYYISFFTRILFSKPPPTSGRTVNEQKVLLTLKNFQYNRGGDSQDFMVVKKDFVSTLSEIKEFLDKRNVKLVLLQYPNLEHELVTAASRELNIMTVDSRSAFTGILSKDNYKRYFHDQLKGTGHMTILGAELYARSLVSQLPTVFKDGAQ